MKEINLKISGMNCMHCVKAVKKVLSKYNIENVEVEIGKAKFKYDEKTDLNDIISDIQEEGYTVI